MAPTPYVLTTLVGLLAWAAASDLRTRSIPNACTLGGGLLTGVLALAGGASVGSRALPVLAVVLPLGVASAIRPRSMGSGDVKLAVLLAAALGPAGIAALLAGFVSAVAWAVSRSPLHPVRSMRGAVVPLAPFVAFGSAVIVGLVG